jgi:hypothetical protein
MDPASAVVVIISPGRQRLGSARYWRPCSRTRPKTASKSASGDENIIRIGTQGVQKATVIAGIFGSPVNNGSAVYVTSTGELGVQGSSERYKTAITPMGDSTRSLDKLHQVNFRYKTDPTNTTQHGLIAEDVAKVYPELVIRDDSGAIQGVRYEELAPMLLNEMLKQERTIADQGPEAAGSGDASGTTQAAS